MTDKRKPAPMWRRYGFEMTPILPQSAGRLSKLLIVFLVILVGLMACSAHTTKSTPRQSEPTPLVTCNEHQPADDLPADPVPPTVESPDQLAARHMDASAYAIQYRQIYQYVLAKDARDIVVAGVVQQLRIQRAATANCLDDYRRRGVIL